MNYLSLPNLGNNKIYSRKISWLTILLSFNILRKFCTNLSFQSNCRLVVQEIMY